MGGPAKPKLADAGALIRAAKDKRRTDTYDLCTDPDLVAEYEDLLEQLAEDKSASKDSLAGGGGHAAEIQAKLDALQKRIDAATVELTFRALPRPRYRAIVDAHPPVKNESGEIIDRRSAQVGVDYDAFFTDLVRSSLVSPELDEETVTTLLDEVLSEAQWKALTTVVWNLNMDTVDVPFSRAGSARTRSS